MAAAISAVRKDSLQMVILNLVQDPGLSSDSNQVRNDHNYE